jgi:Ca-activated chloride channel homolog
MPCIAHVPTMPRITRILRMTRILRITDRPPSCPFAGLVRLTGLLLFAGFGVLATTTSLSAQGWIETDRLDRPGPLVRPASAVERVRTHVRVRIEDRVAHVEVEEWFRNTGRALAEGVYLHPLPGETVFQGYALFQGDAEFSGEMMDADEARSIYEEIVRRRLDPALIELVGQGLLQARVFPFQPGETRRITLRYTQLLDRAGEALVLRYAVSPVDRGEPGPASAPLGFTVEIPRGEGFLDPFSPTHRLDVTREDGALRIRPAEELRGRFALFLPPAGEPVRLALATHRPASGDGYFMLTLSPEQVATSSVPRDLTAVVDVSGSMAGEKLEQTKRALLQLLGSLGPEDRFRLIRFSSGVEVHRPGWTEARPADLEEARRWVRGLVAQGGTNISGALEETFQASTPEGRLPVVVFLTDGLPTVGERNAEAMAAMADRLRGRARVFAFGVGYDVDTYLLDRLASAGGGSVQYVGPGEDVEDALGALAMKIRHPVLTDLVLGNFPVQVREVFPTRLPDLFAGEVLTLFGRYAAAGSGAIRVSGEREGRSARFESRATFPEHSLEHDYLPRLWAARKIGELTREIRIHGPDPELVEEVRRTALRYGILSEFTSYLVLEPDMVAGGGGMQAPRPVTAGMRSGESAVRSAVAAGAARTARSAADVAVMESMAMDAAAGGGVPRHGMENLRVVAGRAFVLREGTWTDRLHEPGGRVLDVAAFSPAYFALLRELPELAAWWRSLSPALVAGRATSLRVVDAGGEESLSAAELRILVRDFREPERARGGAR